MKKYEKPFVKETAIELDEILAGSEFDGRVPNNEPDDDDNTAYPGKEVNVWE